MQETGPADRQLARLLETSPLERAVPRLAPETLHELIRTRGLDACGEIVASATPAQLAAVFDLDLWRRPRPGLDERFDEERFGEWLEMLVDAGEAVAARTLAAMDAPLVIAGLSRHIRVFDPGTFEPTASTDDERQEDHARSGADLSCEVGGYLLCATRADAWDAIVTLLVTLDAGHPDFFHAVMGGCRRLSNAGRELDGLDDLLADPEQMLHDVAIERDRRREEQGYLTPADARAFLQAARRATRPRPADVPPAAAPPARAGAAADAAASAAAAGADTGVHADTDAGAGVPAAYVAPLQRLLSSLDETDEAYLARHREIAFLANALMAGCSAQSRPFTPQQAADAVAAVCSLGLEHWPEALPDTWLADHTLVPLFELGWTVLYEDVCLFAADRLIAMLAPVSSIDTDVQRDLHALRRALATQRDAGTPWLAQQALEVIAILDMPAWAGLIGLLEECPVVPDALVAIVEGRTGAISPTAFAFISTRAQIRAVHAFLAKLPDLLVR